MKFSCRVFLAAFLAFGVLGFGQTYDEAQLRFPDPIAVDVIGNDPMYWQTVAVVRSVDSLNGNMDAESGREGTCENGTLGSDGQCESCNAGYTLETDVDGNKYCDAEFFGQYTLQLFMLGNIFTNMSQGDRSLGFDAANGLIAVRVVQFAQQMFAMGPWKHGRLLQWAIHDKVVGFEMLRSGGKALGTHLAYWAEKSAGGAEYAKDGPFMVQMRHAYDGGPTSGRLVVQYVGGEGTSGSASQIVVFRQEFQIRVRFQ